MTREKVVAELSARGNVKMGDLRELAKRIKLDALLSAELWATGKPDAMMLSTLIAKPKLLSAEDLDRMVGEIPHTRVADWFGTNILKPHPQKESRRERWMDSKHEITARMGWSLTTERVIKSPEGLDISALLDRIEKEMGSAPEDVKWTMNFCLGEIGINHPKHRDRAIAIGEKVGAYRDYPTSKGCTSPYVPIWVAEMVSRQSV